MIVLYRWLPSILQVLTIIRPGDADPLAPLWPSLLLALEVSVFGPAAARGQAAFDFSLCIRHRADLATPLRSEGMEGLLKDATRPSRVKPLTPEKIAQSCV
ncbi:MAG: hypothetical protein JO283_13890 [Bradyrhizobium sp.]|nr:hypothetical protein [Bradyrhizobium sp.]